MYRCSTCKLQKLREEFHEMDDETRPCAFVCRLCRSNDYYMKRYGKVCPNCMKAGKILSNGICKKCNHEIGLKQCKKCGQVLPAALCFYSTKSTCKQCLKIRQD